MPEEEAQQTPEVTAGEPFLASDTLGKIAPAILKAQEKLKNPAKNAKNPHFGNRYADLGASMDAARECLHAQGISLVQMGTSSPYGTVGLTTLLLHTSGEYLGGTFVLPLDRDNAQGAGSAITYARRYGLQAVLGMVAEDDDDGNAASGSDDDDRDEHPRKAAKKGLFGGRQ